MTTENINHTGRLDKENFRGRKDLKSNMPITHNNIDRRRRDKYWHNDYGSNKQLSSDSS